jgi:hypothetical protein
MNECKPLIPEAATLTELYDRIDTALLQVRAIHQVQCTALASNGLLSDGTNGHIEMVVATLIGDARNAVEELHQRALLALSELGEGRS